MLKMVSSEIITATYNVHTDPAIGTVDLLQSIVVNNIGNGVEQLQRPDSTVPVYQVTSPLTGSTSGNQWSLIISTAENRLAWFARVSSDYVGNLVRWEDNLLDINILQTDSNTRQLSIQLNDSPALKFQLPSTDNEFQSLGFTLRDGLSLSVYADCNLIRSSNIPQMFSLSTSNSIQIFGNASDTSSPLVGNLLVIAMNTFDSLQ